MANQYHPIFLLLLSLLLLPLLCIASSPSSSSSSHKHHHQDHYPVLKSLHFSLYQHETINQTGYIIVNGVAGAGVGQTTTPFGTIFAFNDKMTTKPGSSSNNYVKGIAEGASITCSLDGLRSVSFAKITLKIKGYQGSISILGGTHNIKPANHPVVGGTGDFMFVQGFVRSSPVDLQGVAVVYKIEFHLYWPPYAAAAVHGF